MNKYLFQLFFLVKPNFLKIQKFADGFLKPKISVIQRYQGIYHRIFEISEIVFDDTIDHHIGMRKRREIIFPKSCFFCSSSKRPLKFSDSFLRSTASISLCKRRQKTLRYLQICIVAKESDLPDQGMRKTILRHIGAEERQDQRMLFLEQSELIDG